MIDVTKETLLSMSEAARRLPSYRAGRPVHPSTVARWGTHGVKGVKLETVQLGGRTLTTVEAMARFADACSARGNFKPGPESAPGNASADEARQADVEDELRRRGV